MMNKKGSLMDLFIFLIVAFVLVITVGILIFSATTTYDKIKENSGAFQKVLGDDFDADQIIDETLGQVPNAYSSLKWITTMLILGMGMGILISGYLTRTKPVFFIAYILIMIIAIIVSVPLSNTFETVYNNPALSETFQGFWGAKHIFLNLPIWVTVLGMLAGIIMFVNMQRYEGGYY